MMNSLKVIAQLLEGTLLQGHEMMQLEIPESEHYAFAIQISSDQALPAWTLLRSRLSETNRYPVLVSCWIHSSQGWQQDVIENDFFSRFEYNQEPFQGEQRNSSPEAIIARAPSVDVSQFLTEKAAAFAKDLTKKLAWALAEIQEQCGTSPDKAEIETLISTNQITSLLELERWLFNWQLQTIGQEQMIATQDVSYLDWYAYEQFHQRVALLLLPTPNSWNALAYLHWFGACSVGSDVAIAFLQRWHERHAAELVYHHGTMLQFNVGKLPANPAIAFELAWEQRALAPCTTLLPGVSLRDHAWSLLKVNRWFLHERP